MGEPDKKPRAKPQGALSNDRARQRADKIAIDKVRAIAMLRQGIGREQTMRNLGRAPRSFYNWTEFDSRFRAEAIAATAAYEAQLKRQRTPFRERQDEFAPIRREDYATWAEYVVAFRKAYFGFETFDHQWAILEAWDKSPPGGISLVLLPPEAGKALALDTPIPTPTGFTPMGELCVGDEVIGSDGKPCRVTYVSPTFTGNRCFEVIADDGASVVADADHLWPVRVSGNKGPNAKGSPNWKAPIKIKTTQELAKKRSKRPCLQMGKPLDLPDADLPIPPYVLGVWLGDGASAGGRIYSADDDAVLIREKFESYGYETRDVAGAYAWSVVGLQPQLRALGVLGNKHIPMSYLRASARQRTELLQGLIDTDGYVAPNGLVEFTSTNAELATGTLNLVRSLGVKAGLAEGRATLNGRDISAKYRVTFFMAQAATLPRKAKNCKDGSRRPHRYLEAVEVPSVPTRCIAVDAPDHLYLAGTGYLVTHNTTLLADTVVADLCADPNTRRALVSEGQDFASKLMARIQRRLVFEGGEPPMLFQHFGPFQPAPNNHTKKWNSTEFTLDASDHDEQDPSVVSVGVGSNIRGARWDAVDLDDVQSLKSQNKTKWLIDVFRGDIVTRPGRHGRVRITGSRVCRGDFYEELERLELIDEIVTIPALDLRKPVGHQSYFPRQFDANGVAITNEKGEQMGWSDEDLAQRRQKVGEDMWSRIYMMKPQSDFAAMLNAEDIARATDQDRHVGAPVANSVATIASLDPSLSAHAAFTFCGYDSEHLYVMDVWDRLRLNTNQNLHAEIRAGTRRYRPEWWVIENNTLQKGYLTDDAFLALRDEFGFQAVGHHTGATKTSQDLAQLGVPAMIDAIVRGEIRFPRVTENDTDLAMLFDQLLAWRPDIPTRRLTQDLVMALWFAYLRWRHLRQIVDVDLTGWRRDGLSSITAYPYARTNVDVAAYAPPLRAPVTYEQQWSELARQSS